MKETC